MLSTINREKYPLFVLSASAGSGKTYQLVLQYLSILLNTKSPNKFKSIVAITFTNKASLEMKTRIIDALFNLAKYKSVEGDSKTAEIIDELEKLLKIDSHEIIKRSGNALKSILHGYENFNVSTIDKFNLRLIKSFSNDLDLPSEFEISLNEDEVLDEVLDLMLNSIGENGNTQLTKLLKSYAKSNFKDGNQWNFKRQLMSFASSLSKEKNKVFIQMLKDLSFDQEEYNAVQDRINELNKGFVSTISPFAQLFYSLNINDQDLPYKSQTFNALLKIAKTTKCPMYNSNKSILSSRIQKYCEEEGDTQAFTRELKDLLLEIQKCYLEISPEMALLVKYKSNFFNMALLRYIFDSLSEHKEKNKIIRISEFNELIGNLVQKEDAPYIYERFGIRYEHFLLDEFQDTSRLQWLNLLPLIKESLSHRKENLIVGDPKQSIYRFNNGLAEQFVSLPKIYNPEKDEYVAGVSSYFQKMGLKKPLVDNYRSCPEVILFNDEVFTRFKERLPEKFQEFYESVTQYPKSEKQGYVKVISEEEKKNLDQMVLEITEIISKAENDNFDYGDICILTAKNDLAVSIANELTKKGISVFSQESLLISKNIEVRLLLSYLKWRMRPTMETSKRQFGELFFRMHPKIEDRYFDFIKEVKKPSGYVLKSFDDKAFLKEFFGGRDAFFRPFENIYQLAIEFLTLMKWKEVENPFMHQFLDLIFQFQNNRQSDLSKFIEYYEENKSSFALKMPDTMEAVQIMTIHKAKGLEFPIVIIPEMDFGLSLRGDSKFFVQTEDKILYTNLSENSLIQDINQRAEEEKNLIFLDKLNMLYVAFTRAEKRLYVFNRYSGKSNLGSVFHKCMVDAFPQSEENESLEYISGVELDKYENSQNKISQETVFYIPQEIDTTTIPLVLNDDIDDTFNAQEERLFGIYFHQYMADINDFGELKKVHAIYEKNDAIDREILIKINKSANLFFDKANEKNLYKDVLKIYNERTILIQDSADLRPDKILERKNDIVVIDFKTGNSSPKHNEQIWNYKMVLEELFEKPVKAILYYTKQNNLIEI
ncbi:MAG: hypothetical protein DBW72_06510 [Flavobacteriales bacterium]|nr:MAG: hypothetical protein DBW72_06510 [Flavobacteriales bacterium]